MASSTLFIISTLALLGAAAAQYCNSDSQGELYGEAVPFLEITVPPGPNTVTFPNPCASLHLQLQGLKVTACSDYPPAPVVQVLDLQRAFIDSQYGARVDAVAYCGYSHRPAAGGRKPAGHHHSQIMLAHNLFQ